jgi:Na+/H+ antiporter NhaD/arsenite permease-like protein
MTHQEHSGTGRDVVPFAILVVIGLYIVGLAVGWPQHATEQIVADHSHAEGAAHADSHDHAEIVAPPLWTVLPFVVLLGGIAVIPLIPALADWWHSNLNRFLIAMLLATLALLYYGFLHRTPIEGHFPSHHVVQPADSSMQLRFIKTVLANAILNEFVPFIVLLFTLFTICGGIRITGDLQAHPATNAIFLGVGALLASFIGTTGAAMLLIRPLLETNRERKNVAHTIVFFIFTVCNCGGCLLPIGDPPLFLGYLQGVPFMWTFVLWREWLFTNGILIVVYLLLDGLWFYRREAISDLKRDVTQQRRLAISGWKLNVPLLVGVVLAVAILDPSKAVPGTTWHAWLYLREAVQLGLVAMSLFFGDRQVRSANRFNYHPIVEVAAIFSGIFITMQPALQILSVRGDELGVTTPVQFFWVTGLLSSVLDNAPTYLVFFQTAQAMTPATGAKLIAGVEELTLIGISLGAVFMGAMTYIGNGPNFMVRTIAEESGVKMPSFFGYMLFSCLILLPILAAMVWIYLLFPY